MSVQGSDISVRIKKQSAFLTPASGAGATLIRVRPSAGLQRAVATIERQIIDRSGMKAKSRQGSVTATAAYETELEPNNLDVVFGGVLGNVVTAPITVANTDVTDITISGTGTVATTTSGSLITLGIRAGMLIKFTSLSVSGNNGVWVPVLAVTATTMALAPGYIIDNALDNAFSFVTGSTWMTPTPRLKEHFTVEEYIDSLDKSRLGTDMRFTNLQIQAGANAVAQVGFGLTGRDLEPVDSASAPVFTSPDAPEGEALVLLDGALYRNGVAAVDLTSITLGLAGQANITPLATDRFAAGIGLSQFAFTGQIAGLMEDLTQFQASIDEDLVSMMLVFQERGGAGDIVSVYAGNCSYAQSTAPITDGDVIETTTLYGGKDTRGGGYAASTFVISKTHA